MAQFTHPKLGKLKGLAKPGNVTQFHNIPYAFAERFGEPKLVTGKLSGDIYDATKLGYANSLSVLYTPLPLQLGLGGCLSKNQQEGIVKNGRWKLFSICLLEENLIC